MSHQKAKVGDRMVGTWRGRHHHSTRVSGSIVTGSSNVLVNGKGSARVGDRGRHSRGKFVIVTGRPDVLVNGRRTAYKGSKTNNLRGSGTLVTGSNNVFTS